MRSECNTSDGAYHFDPVFSYRTGWGDIEVYGYRGEGYIHICLSYWPKTKKWTVVVPKLKRPSEEW